MLRRIFTFLALLALTLFPGDRLLLPTETASAQGVNNLQYLKVIAVNITPAATAAAIGVAEQTFSTFLGLSTGDQLLVIGPVPTALCPPVGFRVSATNTLQVDFAVLTAAACTPAAGVYTVYSFKSS